MSDKTSEALLNEIIEKHGFIVRITTEKDDPFWVLVNFAGLKQVYYRIVCDEEGDIYGIGYWSSLMETSEDPDTKETLTSEEFIPMNKTVIRLYILCDIFRQCREMSLSYEIIRSYNEDDEVVEFMDLIPLEMSEEEVNEEMTLDECVSRIISNDIPIGELTEALEKGCLLQNFNILKGTLI
jgi:hypothetical protein